MDTPPIPLASGPQAVEDWIKQYATGGGGSFTAGGDLAGTSTSQTVTGLTGSAGVVSVNTPRFNIAGSTLTFADSSGVARDVIDSAHGRLTMGGGGTDFKAVCGPLAGAEASWAACAFLPSATVPSSSNSAFLGNGGDTYVNAPSGTVYITAGGSTVYGAFNGTNPAASGMIRASNNTTIVAARNAANTADMSAIATNASNYLVYGDITNNGNAITLIPFTGINFGGYGGWNLTWGGGTLTSVAGNMHFGTSAGTTYHTYLMAGTGQDVVDITSATTSAGTGNTSIIGSVQLTTRTVTSSFTIDTTTTDYVILADTSGGVLTITLPAPTNGRSLLIIDKTNSFGTHNCTLARHGSEKIDGSAANQTLSSTGMRRRITSDGTDWYTEN